MSIIKSIFNFVFETIGIGIIMFATILLYTMYTDSSAFLNIVDTTNHLIHEAVIALVYYIQIIFPG